MTDPIVVSEPDQTLTEALKEVGVSVKTTRREEVTHHITAIDFRLPERGAKHAMLLLQTADKRLLTFDPGAPATYRALEQVGVKIYTSKEGFGLTLSDKPFKSQFAQPVDWYVTVNPETDSMLCSVVEASAAKPEPSKAIDPPIPDSDFDAAEAAARKMSEGNYVAPDDSFEDYSHTLQNTLEKLKPSASSNLQMALFKAATGFETFRAAWEAEEPEELLIGKLQQFQRPQQRGNGHSEQAKPPVETKQPTQPKKEEKPAPDVPAELGQYDAETGELIDESAHEHVSSFFDTCQTLTRIPLARVTARLNAKLPPSAYKAIPYGPMEGKTDVKSAYLRQRFDEVFGPHGIGWRIVPHPTLGRVEWDKVTETDKEGKEKTWHVCTYDCWQFEYAIVHPDGSIAWISLSPMSDSDRNIDKGYAARGCATSLQKQAWRTMGGMNHFLIDRPGQNTK